MMSGTCTLAVVIAGASAISLWGAPPPRFDGEVLPILKSRCLACHDAKSRQAGLSLTSRDEVLKGGKSGPAVVPGKAAESLLLTMVSSGKMPMGGKPLAADQIQTLRDWIEAGALRAGETGAPAPAVAERDVEAILSAKCWVCHGRITRQAGLDLRSRAGLLKGGKSGPAIVPGNPGESLLIRRVTAQEMPPPKLQEQFSVRGLTSDELDKVRNWIAGGAPAGDETPLDIEAGADPLVKPKDREFWSFRPPQRPAVPKVRNGKGMRNPVDAFLLEKLEAKGLGFAVESNRRSLIRRAYLDLIGLPPAPAELARLMTDMAPDAYERMIDALLESPRYGERWARYWLDAVGYADSEGGTSADELRPHAWRYRDYVIRSLNSGKPYDRFLTEQIAGDELFDYRAPAEYTPEQVDLLAATGFWRMGPDSTYSTEQNFIPERMDVIAAQLEILGGSVLGLSVGCARCHDHKYDPIPQRDYYRLAAILMPAYDPFAWRAPSLNCGGVGAKCDDHNTRYLPLRIAGEAQAIEAHNAPILARVAAAEKELEDKTSTYRNKLIDARLEKLPAGVRVTVRQAFDTPEGQRSQTQKSLLLQHESALSIKSRDIEEAYADFKKEKETLDGEIREAKTKLKAVPRIRALFDLGSEPPPTRILFRGEATNPGPLVAPGVVSVVSAGLPPYRVEAPPFQTQTSGRRLALARWLTQPNHPLTARVMVNRLWQHHFGNGLVASAGNFGRMGTPPSNAALLDWLATEFVDRRWDINAMHRLIMTSAAYRQSTQSTDRAAELDPSNVLLSRFPLRRLDADALRDSILQVAGRLETTAYGPPVALKVMPDGETVTEPGKIGDRRSIYLTIRRTRPISLLETFDAPFLNPNCVKRAESVVSSQALELLNSDLVRETSRYLAGRIIDHSGEDHQAQIERLYGLTFSRGPTPEELNRARQALESMEREWTRHLEANPPAEPIRRKAQWLALSTLCHTLLNSAEFLYVD
ncbi:MAG: PSD1 and planctomycete cytochrome C domain-containing protein [Bryobacteraceae bacterium]